MFRSARIRSKIYENKRNYANTDVGKYYTDFDVWESSISNSTFSAHVGKGKYTIVEFWSTWCNSCISEKSYIYNIQKKFNSSEVECMSILIWDNFDNFQNVLENDKIYNWPQLFDKDDYSANLYGIRGIPHIILFDPEGKVVARGLRNIMIEQELNYILNKKDCNN